MAKIDHKPRKWNTDKVTWAAKDNDQWQTEVKDNLKVSSNNHSLEHNFHQVWTLSNSSNITSKNKISNNKTIWCKIKVINNSNNSMIQGCNNQWLEIFNHRANAEILWLRYLIIKIKTQWWVGKWKWVKVCKDNNWTPLKERN